MAPVDCAGKPVALLMKQIRGVGFNSSGEIVNLRMRGSWTPEEDVRLKCAVGCVGPSNWNQIACAIGTRTARQARDRWHNFLKPDLSHQPFTPDEDRLLIELHGQLGNHWALVAERMPGRGPNQVKNRWYTTLASRGAEPREKPAAERHGRCGGVDQPATDSLAVTTTIAMTVPDEPWIPAAFEFGDWFLPLEWEEERNW
jgi:hypothetical protein